MRVAATAAASCYESTRFSLTEIAKSLRKEDLLYEISQHLESQVFRRDDLIIETDVILQGKSPCRRIIIIEWPSAVIRKRYGSRMVLVPFGNRDLNCILAIFKNRILTLAPASSQCYQRHQEYEKIEVLILV